MARLLCLIRTRFSLRNYSDSSKKKQKKNKKQKNKNKKQTNKKTKQKKQKQKNPKKQQHIFREIFLFYHEIVCCMYPLESPHRGDSNDYTQHTIIV